MLKIYYRKSLRLKNWDYGWNGIYYVTIQTNCSFSIFGEINNGKMILSKFGKIADRYWRDIPNRFSHVRLDEYVIMPDHIHGIVIIDKNKSSDAINRVTTQNINNCHIGGITGNNNPMLYQNLSRIIRWYKGRVTFEIRNKNKYFQWQPRFYDRIIDNNKVLFHVRRYIINNPINYNNHK